jgi:hypothetical protein
MRGCVTSPPMVDGRPLAEPAEPGALHLLEPARGLLGAAAMLDAFRVALYSLVTLLLP